MASAFNPRPLLKGLAGLLGDTRLRFLQETQQGPIAEVSEDVWIEAIFPYLGVEDIIALRRVNKYFYVITHANIIWKRFLTRLRLPKPPLIPTFDWSNRRFGYEIEQMVTRAVTADDNWRSNNKPRSYFLDMIPVGDEIMEVKMLPGGKYMVASLKDGHRWYIAIYCFEGPKLDPTNCGRTVLRPMAQVRVRGRAYKLQAKYLKIHGEDGMMIMFLTRNYNPRKPGDVDLNMMPYDVPELEHPKRVEYEVTCVHARLQPFESLDSPPATDEYRKATRKFPKPFLHVGTWAIHDRLDEPSLYTHFERVPASEPTSAVGSQFQPPYKIVERPYAMVIRQGANKIDIYDLERNERFSIVCRDPPNWTGQYVLRITAARVLPNRQLFVIRTAYHRALDIKQPFPALDPDAPAPKFNRTNYAATDKCGRARVHIFEMYSLPTTSDVLRLGDRTLSIPATSLSPCRVGGHEKNKFQIADFDFTPRAPDAPCFYKPASLPTFSVFIHSMRYMKLPDRKINVGEDPLERVQELPCELLVFDFYPTTLPTGHQRYMAHYHSSHGHLFPDWPIVLPGQTRYLALTIPRGDLKSQPTFNDLWRRFRFEPRSVQGGYMMKDDVIEETTLTRGRHTLPSADHIWAKFAIPDSVKNVFKQLGVRAAGYDESIGRVVIVPGGNFPWLLLLEASEVHHPDDRLQLWGGCMEC